MKLPFIIIMMFAWYGLSCYGVSVPVRKVAKNQMPVFISYLKKIPPDSIQDFVKIYLQTKKFEVINWETAMQLFKQEMSEEMISWINSGKINNKNQVNPEEFVRSLKPVCTVLAIDLYRDSANQTNFVIDSILWHTGTMPVKDSNFTIYKFIPAADQKPNPYYTLKSFADEVFKSGKLN